MLRDLRIQNYRCFEDFHIDGLTPVNLIVGKNNIGKTSLLEAIYFLKHKRYEELKEILFHRYQRYRKIDAFSSDRYMEQYPLRSIFYNQDANNNILISCNSENLVDLEAVQIKNSSSTITVSYKERSDMQFHDYYYFSTSNLDTLERSPMANMMSSQQGLSKFFDDIPCLLLSERPNFLQLSRFWSQIRAISQEKNLRVFENYRS